MAAKRSEDEAEDEEEFDGEEEDEEEDEEDDSSEESGSGEDGSGEPDAPTPNILQRGSRLTAGRNTVRRQGKALEDDQTFWGHQDFAEGDSSDSDVRFSSDALGKEHDSSDSDFDKSEVEEKSGEAEAPGSPEAEAKARRPARRLLPQVKAKGAPRRPPPREPRPSSPKRARRRREAPLPDRVIRNSTMQRRIETEALQAQRGATGRRTGRRHAAPALTQQERLEEAARTEAQNLQEFQAMSRWEDESKQRSQRGFRRRRYAGPRVRFVSSQKLGAAGGGGEELPLGAREGVGSFLEFIDCDLPENLRGGAWRPPQAQRCAVTGQLAKYRDPLTGQPFATAEAFAQLRAGSSGRVRVGRALPISPIDVDSPS